MHVHACTYTCIIGVICICTCSTGEKCIFSYEIIHVCFHFRKTIHYNLEWKKNLDDHIVATAPYGGPIGILYLQSIHIQCVHVLM